VRSRQVFGKKKDFIAENNTWERKKDLENARKLVNKFERRLEVEVR